MKNLMIMSIALSAMIFWGCSSDGEDETPLPSPDPSLVSISDLSINEGTLYNTVSVGLQLSPAASADVSVTVSTADGTAESGLDFIPINSETIVFTAGEISKTVDITIVGENVLEEDETFEVSISNVTGTATIDDGTATVTILNDDATVGGVTITLEPTIDYDALLTLAPGSEVPYEIYNFGQPANVSNENYTSFVGVEDSLNLFPNFLFFTPLGDTLFYNNLTISPSNWQDYATAQTYFAGLGLGTGFSIIPFGNEPDDIEFKYSFELYIGTPGGRLGPFIVDPKIRILGQ